MASSRSLRDRVAGQSAMSALVIAQREAPSRGRLGRLLGQSPLTARSRQHYRAALGELAVGDALEHLGQRWDVLHELPLDGSRLDHLAIGPAGVFAVRAANYRGEDVIVDGESMLVSGGRVDDIRQVASQADAVAAALASAGGAVEVVPLLVVVDPRVLVRRAVSGRVRVLIWQNLERTLDKSAPTLDGDEVARISDLAERAGTWPGTSADPQDTLQLHSDFAEVRSEVRAALRRRLIWAAVGTMVVYVLAWAAVAALVSTMVSSAAGR